MPWTTIQAPDELQNLWPIESRSSPILCDPLEDARAKLHAAAERLGVPEALPALLAVLCMEAEGPELAREVLFAGIRAFFQALTQRGPLLLIQEDMHSAEDVTLDFLEHTADWIRESVPDERLRAVFLQSPRI